MKSSWIGPKRVIQCPHCGQKIEIQYDRKHEVGGVRPPRRYNFTATYDNYREWLERLPVGESFVVPKNRRTHYGNTCARWYREHPEIETKWAPEGDDGAIRVTRIR